MRHLHIRAVLAVVTFAVSAAPLTAQQSPDQLFRSYLATAGSLATPVAAPWSSGELVSTEFASNELVSVDRARDDEGPAPIPAMASVGHTRLYLLGGAALAAGTLYALQSRSGASAVPVTTAPQATASTPSAPIVASTPGLSPPTLATNPTVTVNPEPATVLLMVTGLLGVGAVARRRRAA
ncbi:MAG TPA: PEP-CTERM sorting domain-containing protein [Gemmatimonadaceae bacterium]|nr:PEP-CTERM sorting domain-containing protein [Gemmatimonadaceae bacterium]